MSLRVRNWRKFQHYNSRRPPWIKLHHDLLDDYEYQCLPLASMALAPLLWLLASESTDGSLPDEPEKLAFRLHRTAAEVVDAIKPLIERGLLEGSLACKQDASKPLASRKQDAMPETETETETYTEERETDSPASAGAPDLVLVPDSEPVVRQAAKVVKRRPPAASGKPVQAVLVPEVQLDDWPSDWVARLVEVWSRHGHLAHGRLGATLRPLRGGAWSFVDVEAGLARYLAAGKAQFGPEPFAQSVGEWISGRAILGGGGPLARQQQIADANAASLHAVVNFGRRDDR